LTSVLNPPHCGGLPPRIDLLLRPYMDCPTRWHSTRHAHGPYSMPPMDHQWTTNGPPMLSMPLMCDVTEGASPMDHVWTMYGPCPQTMQTTYPSSLKRGGCTTCWGVSRVPHLNFINSSREVTAELDYYRSRALTTSMIINMTAITGVCP
jgi:hypothetical protein